MYRENKKYQGITSVLSGWRTIVLLFAIFFGLSGFCMLYLYNANDGNAKRLAFDGLTSLATITRKHVDTSHNSNKDASGFKRYVLEYSFPVSGSEKEWQGNDQVTESEYDTVKIGDQFDVRYWPKNPDIATILEDSYADGAQLAKTISTVLLSLAVLMVFVLLIRRPMRKAIN